jgi:hypothetical protein
VVALNASKTNAPRRSLLCADELSVIDTDEAAPQNTIEEGLGPAGAAGVAIVVSFPMVATASFFWWRKMKSESDPALYKQDVEELLMEEEAEDGVVLRTAKKRSVEEAPEFDE